MILFRITLGLTLLLSASASFAQTTPAPAPRGSQVFVFGDVARPAIFTSKSTRTVSDLLSTSAAGGLTCKTANVRIVRVTPSGSKLVGAALVSQGQRCEQKVESGDILVVHDLDRLTSASTKPNVVAIVNSKIPPLFAPVGEGYTASNLLKSDLVVDGMQLNFGGRKFSIIRTHPKAVPVPAGQDAVLMHGDILIVAEGPEVATSQIQTVSQEAPVVPKLPPDPGPTAGPLLVPISQQTTELPADPTDDQEPIPVAADYGAVDAGLPPVPPGMQRPVPLPQPSTIPPMTPPAVQTGIPDPIDLTAPQDPLSIDPFSASSSTLQPPPPAGAGPGLQQPGMPQQLNTAQAGMNDAGFGVPGQPGGNPYGNNAAPGTQTPGDAVAGQSDAAASSLPLPSELDAVVQDNSSNATMWYVAGLGGALVVVLGAWAYGSRMMAEAPQVERSRYQRPVSKRPSANIKHPPVSDRNPSQPKPSEPAMERPAPPKIKPIAAAAAPTTPQPKPVAPAAPAAVPPPAPAPSPMVAQAAQAPVAPAPATAPPVVPEPVVTAVVSQPVTPPRPETPPAPMPTNVNPPTSSFTPISIPVSQPASTGLQNAPTAAVPSPPPAPPMPPSPPMQKPEPIPVPDTSTTRLLDSLINNSIPITEEPVQLPGNAEYYGDSNGPQHLRLDPPQTELRGHHLGNRAGQRQTTHSNNSYSQQ